MRGQKTGDRFDVAVIGGGVVGCAILRELSRYRLKLILLEKNSDLAEGITKANSGVIHAGFNVRPGTLKARLNDSGRRMIYDLASVLQVPHRKTGKLVVAPDEAGRKHLEELRSWGERNGTPGLEIIDEAAVRAIEPEARGRWALHSPETGIISPYEFTIALAENAGLNGAEIRLGKNVIGIAAQPDRYALATQDGSFSARWVINSAGLGADVLAGMAGPAAPRVYPYKGEYLILDKAAGERLRTPIYPVPPRDSTYLGVHLTPGLEGNILLGPSGDYVEDKDDTGSTRQVCEMLKSEAFSLVPALRDFPVIHAFSGIRPRLYGPGEKADNADFIVAEREGRPRWIDLLGIESPGLTAAPAIAAMIAEMIGTREDLLSKPDFEPGLPERPRFAHLDEAARVSRSAADPAWGEMVCRCEHITRAEVQAAIRNPYGANSLDAIKRRTRCGMGRCQGGFCTPRIIEILQAEGLEPEEITKKGGSSRLVFGRVKS